MVSFLSQGDKPLSSGHSPFRAPNQPLQSQRQGHQCPPPPPPPLRTGTGLHLSCQLRERGCDSAGPPLATQLGRSKAGPWLEVCGSQGAPPITQVSPQMKEKTSLWVSQELARKPAGLPRSPPLPVRAMRPEGSLLHWPRPVIPKERSGLGAS